MIDDVCTFCGGQAEEPHHITGRLTGDGPYLDPQLTTDACGKCNKLEDHAWRVAGIARIGDPTVARLRRIAFFSAHLGGQDRPVVLPPRFWLNLALCLTLIADDVERRK